jgi:uncharacterized protein (TIGR02996 family)
MTKREQFLAAVEAEPQDAATYRVFTDWLEEQGEDRDQPFRTDLAGPHYDSLPASGP